MRITFFGAASEVTGSCYLVENGRLKFLVDCGMFQGEEGERNALPFPFSPQEVDFLLLTHAHLDHSGRIPLLVKSGFRGKIYATLPTLELCRVLWLDTVKLMKEEVERANRRHRRSGKPEVEPLFGEDEAHAALELFEPVGYDDLARYENVEFVFRNAAHILGAATLEVWIQGTKVVFSGDVGQFGNVLEGSPPIIEETDFVIIESTYGNRRHKTLEETRKEFSEVITRAAGNCGKILIPTFVVDRAQRVLYELALLQESLGLHCPVFFDSPLGKQTTDIYLKYRYLLSGEMERFHLLGKDPFAFPGLSYVSTPEESKALNDIDRAIILAGSGMCTGGRILHHLKHSLFKETTTVVFVGYQAKGTLGRALVDGAKKVRIFDEDIVVRANIATINGFSVHGDQDDLLRFAGYFKSRPLFLVTHGEKEIAQVFAEELRARGYEALVPSFGDSVDLSRRVVVAASQSFPKKRALDEIEERVKVLREKEVSLGEESEVLLRSALILLEEAERRAFSAADKFPQNGI